MISCNKNIRQNNYIRNQEKDEEIDNQALSTIYGLYGGSVELGCIAQKSLGLHLERLKRYIITRNDNETTSMS